MDFSSEKIKSNLKRIFGTIAFDDKYLNRNVRSEIFKKINLDAKDRKNFFKEFWKTNFRYLVK